MNVPHFLRVHNLKKISSSFDDEILGLESQLKSLENIYKKEKKQITRHSFKTLHGSVDFNKFMELDVLKYPLVEKNELKKLANEYNKTVNLYAKVSPKTLQNNLDKIKSDFDE